MGWRGWSRHWVRRWSTPLHRGGEAIDGARRNGLFTHHLLRHLSTPGLRLGELFEVVADAMEQEARTRYRFEQVPYRSFSYARSFCFAGCSGVRVAEEIASLRQRAEAAVRRMAVLEAENRRLAGKADASGAAAGARDHQADQEARQRAVEIEALRVQLADLQEKGRELEAVRRRVQALERDNREQAKRLVDRDRRSEEAARARPRLPPAF